MSEELLQRDLIKNPEKIGKWNFYNIGATSIKALKESGVLRNVDYGVINNKKVDALIVKNKNVIAVIEYKKPSQFRTKAQKDRAIEQEMSVAKKICSKLLIATDTTSSIWVNPLTGNIITDELGHPVKDLFDPKSEKTIVLLNKILCSINEKNDQIKQKELVNPTDLAKQIWQDVWAVSGATPENCLYTFVELFIFKYLSDLNILKGIHNFYTLMGMYNDNTEDEVLQHYADVVRAKIKTLFPENRTDNTTIINGTIFVSKDQKAVSGYSTVFKKVLQKFESYVKLEHIDYDFKSQLFESFLKESISKKNWGQFFTPLKVVRAIVDMAKDEIKEDVKICDPACGVGKLLLEPIAPKINDLYEIRDNEIIPKITIHGFDKGFDKDEQKTIILAKANMLIYFTDLIKENSGITEKFSELFNESFILKTNSILGTLSEPVENTYDLILTNPPYVSSGSSNLKEEIRKDNTISQHYSINALGVEGLFMEWIIRALKPGGKAFVVIPDGMLERVNDNCLRAFIADECFIDAIISLPEKTFFTTLKKTYILCLTKKINKTFKQLEPVFTYLVSEIGEERDINRFDIDQNDLQEGVTLFSFFKGNKARFSEINNDPRCKIQDFSKFEKNINSSWNIDKWWSHEEKVSLGVSEKENSINFDEVPQLIEDISNNVKELQSQVSELIDTDKPIEETPALFKEVMIGEIFELPPIKGVTAKYIQSNRGDIPVYGGKIEETPIGHIADNLENVKYFENCLAWNREGSVGYVFFHDHKFSTNDHHRPMTIKDIYKSNVDLTYMKYMIQNSLLKQGFKWSKTASKIKVAKTVIEVPIDKSGNFDIEAQKKIASKYIKVDEIKSLIKQELDKVNTVSVEI